MDSVLQKQLNPKFVYKLRGDFWEMPFHEQFSGMIEVFCMSFYKLKKFSL